jgi:Predicted pyridoxal phosphate-dependent enzyme apparently involved in regulation of cell wall biogenesis
LAKRREIARIYFESFKNNPKILSQSGVVEGHAYHLYIIQVEKRKELYDFLRSKNIFCQVHYIPVHFLPYYQSFDSQKGQLPNAEKYYEQCLSLPMFPSLSENELTYVIDSITDFLNDKK